MSMLDLSNEELVMRIKSGEKNLIPELWEQVKNLIAWKTHRYFNLHSADNNLYYDVDDLIQESFFALLQAIEYYEPGEWQFSTYLCQTIKTAFATASGKRTPKQRGNPLNNPFNECVSLDKPLNDESDETLLDFISADENDYEYAEDKIYNEQLHNTLERAMSTLSKEKSQLLHELYYEGRSETELSKKYSYSTQSISNKKCGALNQLYFERKKNGLEAFLSDNIDYYVKVGVTQFNNTWTSATEKAVLARERFEEEYHRKRDRSKRAECEKRKKLAEKIKSSNPHHNKMIDELLKKYQL